MRREELRSILRRRLLSPQKKQSRLAAAVRDGQRPPLPRPPLQASAECQSFFFPLRTFFTAESLPTAITKRAPNASRIASLGALFPSSR